MARVAEAVEEAAWEVAAGAVAAGAEAVEAATAESGAVGVVHRPGAEAV